jgi:hypothetical protein
MKMSRGKENKKKMCVETRTNEHLRRFIRATLPDFTNDSFVHGIEVNPKKNSSYLSSHHLPSDDRQSN